MTRNVMYLKKGTNSTMSKKDLDKYKNILAVLSETEGNTNANTKLKLGETDDE